MKNRCVIVGGAEIKNYERARGFLKEDDYVIYCDSGLAHRQALGAAPSLIIGDFDSYERPRTDTEVITLPAAKDDTDTAFAVREGMRRGFRDFLLLGVLGARADHSMVNIYLLTTLENRGCHGVIIDDYSEAEIIEGDPASGAIGRAGVPYDYPYFSLLALEGAAHGVTIRNAKFNLDDADITPDYQYATSNEALPGLTAEIEIRFGRLLLIKIAAGAAERHGE